MRPGGDRRGTETRQSAASDPLAELAKIVSGRSQPTAPARARVNGAAAEPAAPQPPGGDVLGDLETELLNDLQASFASLRDLVPPTPPAPAPVQAAPEPPPPPPPQVQDFEQAFLQEPPPTYVPQRPEPPQRADRYLPEAAEEAAPSELAERFAPMPPEPEPAPRMAEPAPPRPAPPRFVPQPPFDDDPPVPAPRASRSTRAPAGERQQPDLGSFQMRSTSAPAQNSGAGTGGAGTSGGRSRWERPGTDKPAAGGNASKFAPRTPTRAAPPPPVEDDDDFLDDDLYAAPVDEAGKAEDFPLEGFGETEAYDDDAQYQHEDLASMIEPRRSRGFAIAGVAIAVVLLGGVAVAMFRPGADSGTPPVIVADAAPTKITPEVQPDDGDSANKLIYDRVNSGEETAAGTNLESSNEPLAALPTDQSDSPITRVIIPGGPGIDQPMDDGLSLDGQPSAMPEGTEVLASNDTDAGMDTSGPRRVRTVIVKPDGTIVESAAAEEGAAAPAATTAAATPAPEPVPVPEPAPVTDDTAAIAGSGELAITPVPDLTAPEPTVEPLAVQPTPAPAPAAQQMAAVENTAPLDLTQPPAAPAVAPAPAQAVSGMLVQVSSQRSEDAARATYRDLQERYPSILGSFEPNIQRADVPDRGTFFRVRVGPFSASDAQRLCDDLKSAGGDCLLAQR